MKKLTAKQEAFCREYVIDNNATQAAIRAGYSAKTAQPASSRMLSNVMVIALVTTLQGELAKKCEVTVEGITNELKSLAFSNMSNYVDFGPVGVTLKEMSEMTPEQTAAIQEVSHNFNAEGGGQVKFKLADKRAALVDLGKHLGMFGKDGDPLGDRPVFVGININLGGNK